MNIKKLTSVTSADCCQIALGPIATEMCHQVVQDLAKEEKEGTGSKDKTEARKHNTHLEGATLFKELWLCVLMESAETSCLLCDRTSAIPFNYSALCIASAKLAAKVMAKDLVLVTWWQIQGMLGHLNLYLDEGLSLG